MSEQDLAQRLRYAAHHEAATYAQLAVVNAAESHIRDTHSGELDRTVAAAWQQVQRAEGDVTQAEAIGDVPGIATARDWLRQHHAAAIRVTNAAVIEQGALVRAELAASAALSTQQQRMIDAVHAAATVGDQHRPARSC